MRKININSENYDSEKIDINWLKEIKSTEDLEKIPNFSLINISNGVKSLNLDWLEIDKYSDWIYVLKMNGKNLAYVKWKENLQTIFDEIKEKYSIEVGTKLNLQSHKVVVTQNPKKKIDIGQDFVYANLDRYDIDLLFKMYHNAKDADTKAASKVLNAIYKKLETAWNIESKIGFVKKLDDNNNYNRAIFELLKWITNSQEADRVFNEFGKERLQEVLKQSVLIDDGFAEDYTYYFKAPDDVRWFSVSCGKWYQDKEACENFTAYIFAITRKYHFQNSQVIANLVSKSFDGDISKFKDGIWKSMQQYKEIKWQLPDVAKKVLKEKWLIGLVKYGLAQWKMSPENRKRWTEIWVPLAAVWTAIYMIFKFIRTNSWKWLLGLLVWEIGLESTTWETMFSAFSKLLYGGLDNFWDGTKKWAKESKDKSAFSKELWFPMFALFMMWDYKIEKLKSEGVLKIKDGKSKFDIEKFISILPKNDERKIFLEEMLKKQWKDKVNKMFEQAFDKMWFTDEDFKNETVATLYQKLLKNLEKKKNNPKTTDVPSSSINKKTVEVVKTDSDADDSNSDSGDNTSVEVNNNEGVRIYKSNIPNYIDVDTNLQTWTKTIETTEEIRKTYTIVKQTPDSIFYTLPNWEEKKIDISLRRRFLRWIAKQRYDLLEKFVRIWVSNALMQSEKEWYKIKQNIKKVVEKIVALLRNSKNSFYSNSSEYKKLINSIFDEVFKVEWKDMESVVLWWASDVYEDGKKDIIDKDNAENIKQILLSLWDENTVLSSDKYDNKLLDFYYNIKIWEDSSLLNKFNPFEQWDNKIVWEYVFSKLLSTKYKWLSDELNKLIKSHSILSVPNIINTASKWFKLTEKEKFELYKVIKNLEKKVKKIFEKNKEHYGNAYGQALEKWIIKKDKNGKYVPTREEYLDKIYNSLFINASKFEIVKYLVENSNSRNRFEELFSNINWLDYLDIADNNVEFAREFWFMVLTSMLPAVWAYSLTARMLRLSSFIKEWSLWAQIFESLVASGAWYSASIAYEGIKNENYWESWNIKWYFEFLAFDLFFRGSIGWIKNIKSDWWKILLWTFLSWIAIETWVNVPRYLNDLEIELYPWDWTREELANAFLILWTILASHKTLNGKIEITKTSDWKVKIEEVKQIRERWEEVKERLWNKKETLEIKKKVKEKFIQKLKDLKQQKIETLDNLNPKVSNLNILKQKIIDWKYNEIYGTRKRQDVKDAVKEIEKIDNRINLEQQNLSKLNRQINIYERWNVRVDKVAQQQLENYLFENVYKEKFMNDTLETIKQKVKAKETFEQDLWNGIKIETTGDGDILIIENWVFRKTSFKNFKKEFNEDLINKADKTEILKDMNKEIEQRFNDILWKVEYTKDIWSSYKIDSKRKPFKVDWKEYIVAKKWNDFYLVEKKSDGSYKVWEVKKIDKFIEEHPEYVEEVYQKSTKWIEWMFKKVWIWNKPLWKVGNLWKLFEKLSVGRKLWLKTVWEFITELKNAQWFWKSAHITAKWLLTWKFPAENAWIWTNDVFLGIWWGLLALWLVYSIEDSVNNYFVEKKWWLDSVVLGLVEGIGRSFGWAKDIVLRAIHWESSLHDIEFILDYLVLARLWLWGQTVYEWATTAYENKDEIINALIWDDLENLGTASK